MSLTLTGLKNWINANTQSSLTSVATTTTESDAMLQLCLDAALAHIESHYSLPLTYTVDVELAIYMHAASLWQRRNTPDGVLGVGDFGAVRVSSLDPTVRELLSLYRLPGFA